MSMRPKSASSFARPLAKRITPKKIRMMAMPRPNNRGEICTSSVGLGDADKVVPMSGLLLATRPPARCHRRDNCQCRLGAVSRPLFEVAVAHRELVRHMSETDDWTATGEGKGI